MIELGRASEPVGQPGTPSPGPSPRAFRTYIATCVGLTVGLFTAARVLGWTSGWTALALAITHGAISGVCLSRWNPVLIRRRARIGRGTKGWDVVWLTAFAVIVVGSIVLVIKDPAGWRGTPAAPGLAWLIGAAVFVAGWVVFTWSMAVNPFFEKTVRIQTEHGHVVVDSGPYEFVRHPGYVGLNLALLSVPLLLSSPRLLFPVGIAVLAVLIRTALEDRTLRAELPGYEEYAERVRYRLIPGIW